MARFRPECAATCIAVVTVRVVVHNQGDIGSPVIIERRAEIDGRPIMDREGYIAAVHQVGVSNGNPVGCALKRGLVGTDHIDVHIAGSAVCPRIEE